MRARTLVIACVLVGMVGAASGTASLSDRAVIAAAERAVPVTSTFGGVPGIRRCAIPVGGPSTRYVKGVCRIDIRRGSAQVRVMFTQYWDASAFTGPGSHGRSGTLRHRWIVDLSPGGKVLTTGGRGAFPPQYVK